MDHRNESAWLEMRNVAGLKSVRLNGRPLVAPAESSGEWTIELPEDLLPRNGLVLEFERLAVRSDDPPPWGEIALVIRPR